ncbi:monooxygenase [Metarhizium album ARSEF 1941]|uniref:Monooxygenase n=1 Tax=Metarhizium album (strain ARSEF 1941) TaxID=1081103 RepID=A0A0B2WX91_METAS|nr:monooxygenase [Metarhizium album ARSEF 1941]KHN97490.1 monooxygenase [Metarhizium album ARSEF 1941]
MTTPSSSHKTRCVIIGAGVSGILMGKTRQECHQRGAPNHVEQLTRRAAYKLRHHLQDFVELQIFEKNADLGGTWYENRYPGCACDVPSHCYQYAFAPNPSWSKLYSSSEEIHGYLKKVAKHFDLEQYIRYSTTVVSATWNETTNTWAVGINDETTIQCEILINAAGILHRPQLPDIKGLETFAGDLVHTAAWDSRLDLRGKRVALIGSGSSGIQILPQLQPTCSSIRVYIRTPGWIAPPMADADSESPNRDYTTGEKALFRQDARGYARMRKEINSNLNGMFKVLLKASPEQQSIRDALETRMRSLIRDDALRHHLVPKFEVGCRRVNPCEQFLYSVQEKNVTAVFSPIDEVTPRGLVSGGIEHQVDVIVAATGFDNSFKPQFPVLGRDGVDLRDIWAEEPVSYLGTGVSGFPNYLTFLGPNTPIANGAFMGPLEATSDYFIRLLQRAIRYGASSFDVKPEAQADFDSRVWEFMKKTVWTGSCRSWYKKTSRGKITALWPGSSLHYMQVLAEDRWEDYNWTYKGRRYDYWGNGFSWIEQPKSDKLGIQERKSRNDMVTIPNLDSDLGFYITPQAPLPEE